MVRLILIFSLISNICYADEITFLEKDQKAPYPGYHFTESKAKETRIRLLERDSFEELNQSLTKTNNWLKENSALKDEQIKIVLDRNDNLAKSLRDERGMSNGERILWFVIGVAATSAAVYGVKKASE